MEKRGLEETMDDEVISPSFSIALVLILNIPFHSCKVGYLMWSSFLVILQFLFYHPLTNFFSYKQVERWRAYWRSRNEKRRSKKEREGAGQEENTDHLFTPNPLLPLPGGS